MNTRTKRILLLATAIALCGFTIVGWATVRVVAWARDLPNRFVIDVDAVAATYGAAVTESYHHVLRDGDSQLQTQVLMDQFAPAIASNPDTAVWIGKEYRNDILALVDSDDPKVSSAAIDVIAMLPAETEEVP